MTLAQTLPMSGRSPNRLSFILKIVLAAGLSFLADVVFSSGATFPEAGSVAGLFAMLWLAALLIGNPLIRSCRESRLALAGAGLSALALAYEPGLVATLLFFLYLGLAVFLPRHGGFDNALRWLLRLFIYAVTSPFSILFDLFRLGRARRGSGTHAAVSRFGALALTVVGSLVFLALFWDANPLIGRLFSQVVLGPGSHHLADLVLGHLPFLTIALTVFWASVRPLRLRVLASDSDFIGLRPARMGAFGAGAIIPALASFNLIFALQNVSDLAFLWGGASLPDGMTFSDYAHRGTNALIVAALLACVFVLTFLRTGSPASASRLVRGLVYAWIGQTVLLVFSSMARTLNYIEAYSLTYTRLNALIFMVLVVAGLVLILWRIATGRSGVWLVNANALCVLAVLAMVSFTSYDALITHWNLAQSLNTPQGVVKLDADYLGRLEGSGTLLPLVEVTQDPDHAPAPLMYLRRHVQFELEGQQVDWRRWTLAGFWRLKAAGTLPPPPPPPSAAPTP